MRPIEGILAALIPAALALALVGLPTDAAGRDPDIDGCVLTFSDDNLKVSQGKSQMSSAEVRRGHQIVRHGENRRPGTYDIYLVASDKVTTLVVVTAGSARPVGAVLLGQGVVGDDGKWIDQ